MSRRVTGLGGVVSALFGSALIMASCAVGAGPAADLAVTGRPLVIAHRGASGLRPEHTLAAYELAIEQGADFIEPDLVFTKDGILVARHDRFLSGSTDVGARPEFADRRVIKQTDEGPREDWWAEDFTLAELKTLRARQTFPGRSLEFDGLYEVPTFAEVLDLAKAHGVGVYPETKHPTDLAALGFDFEAPLLAELARVGWADASAPVFIQSFEPGILKSLRGKTSLRLVQLVFPDETGASSVPLAEIATFADGVGPAKALVINAVGEDTGFLGAAHALGLVVHPWTFRSDAPPPDGLAGAAEISRAFALGVDGVFTDFPDAGVAALNAR